MWAYKENYFNKPHKEGYKRQLDFYAYLLKEMKFPVAKEKYIYLVNAKEKGGFNGEMKFQEVLIPYQWNSNWIHGKVTEMIDLLNDNNAPDANPSCKNCAYVSQIVRSGF